MENKSAIWIFTVMLVLACVYQLSFNFFSNRFEDKAAAYASDYVDTLDKDSLNLDESGLASLKDSLRRDYLQDSAGAKAYPLLGHDYTYVKDQELNLGLDLQGGMSVTLEVSLPDLLKNLSGNSKFTGFTKSIEEAQTEMESSDTDFITLFAEAWERNKPSEDPKKLYKIFNNKDYTQKFSEAKTDPEIIEVLRTEAASAISNTENIIRQRIDRLGVAQPNIQRQQSTGRILVELAGVDDPERVKGIIGATAKLEFWPVFDNTDQIGGKAIIQYLQELDSTVAKYRDPAAYQEDLFTIDSIPAVDLETELALKTVDGLDSVTVTRTPNLDVFKRKYPISFTTNDYGLTAQGLLRSSVLFRVTKDGQATINDVLNARKANGSKFADDIIPNEMLLLWDAKPVIGDDGTKFYGLYALNDQSRREKPELSGSSITDAFQTLDEYGNPVVSMQMNSEGAQVWSKMTKTVAEAGNPNAPKCIAITLDGLVYSAPTVREEISGGSSQITIGTGTYAEQMQESNDLANLLEAGSLDAKANIVNSDIVGPTLGAENINKGAWSFIIALIVIMIYMVFYYSRAGIVSDFALILNIFLLIGGLAAIHATLTLPGIAGLVLTLGMAVDANVLIYERIKEEMRAGKGLKQAMTEGYQKAYSAIFDANITTLLVALVLFVFGSGAIKGFATTLIIGIFTSLFSAIVITRLIFWNRLEKKKDIAFSTATTKNWFTNLSYRFVDNRKKFYTLSGILVLASLGALFTVDTNYSVEFEGGTEATIQFTETINEEEVRTFLSKEFDGFSASVKAVGIEGNKIKFTTKYEEPQTDVNADDTKTAKKPSKLETALNAYGQDYQITENTQVAASISDEFRRDARNSTIIALLIIFFYIFFRFRKWQYGLGALLAMIHDVIIVLGLYTIGAQFLPFTMEIDSAFIAALLTVIGYSINDTVVVFDRIREYLGLYKKDDEKEVINKALNSTLSRTINTSLSTFVVLLVIFILGSDSIRGFTFALMVGVIVGTYSSIFIATPSVIDLSGTDKK